MRPLAGRRLWFVGIGGAGPERATRCVAQAWGAEVGGWDRARDAVPRATSRAAGIPVAIVGTTPRTSRTAAEVVVSTRVSRGRPECARARAKTRAELLAELVSLRDSIVVAGAHGKTTTTAMIAFVLDRLGRDPAFLIGGEIPQLGGNARAGEGWLVVEGDESDRTLAAAAAARSRSCTNVELDHHATFASRAEVEELFERLARGRAARSCAATSSSRSTFELARARASTTGATRRRRSPRSSSRASRARRRERVLAEFAGAGRRFELRGEAGGVRGLRRLRAPPARRSPRRSRPRASVGGDGRVLVLFQPHLYSRTRHLAHELGARARGRRRGRGHEVYPAREEPVAGVTGKLVVDALASERGRGCPSAGRPRSRTAVRFLARRARPGDVVLTIGAGDVDRAGPLLLEALA